MNSRSICRRVRGISGLLAALSASSGVQADFAALEQGFHHPPDSARPLVWWHWMNGNITKEGIKLDLEWMHRAGLGGFQIFDVALETPQVVDKRLAYMTPEWKDAFTYATRLADQLGLEAAIAGSPGWSESGGPWVLPSQGMKKYVWSETLVHGGQRFTGKLTHPPTNTGAFQTLPIDDSMGAPPEGTPIPQFYADSAVVAYRQPADEVSLDSLHPGITASGGTPDVTKLTDGDLLTAAKIPIPGKVGESAWIRYEFAQPETLRAVTVVMRDPNVVEALANDMGVPDKIAEASSDGQHFREIARISGGVSDYKVPQYTLAFAPVTAKYFRVSFKRIAPPPPPYWAVGVDLSALGIPMAPTPTDYEISELTLHGGARVERWPEKAAFVPTPNLTPLSTPPVDAKHAIAKSSVIDLTARMRADGTLDWTPPIGEWVVLRLGYSLLGVTNHPATAEATGLEVDKLDRRFVKQYFDRYLDTYRETVGGELMGRRGIQYVINDSWEAGSQNWTDRMIEQFKKRRGYDLIPWVPVLTGRIVESAQASDRFLWDFRKTLADLVTDEHYGQLEQTLHERHMRHYVESHEAGRAFVADGMEVKKRSEVPMSAMWTGVPGVNTVQYGFNADDRESASVAHIYGQNLAAAESLTATAAPWAWSPSTLKSTADQEFLNGINRLVIHESAHQPLLDQAPGMTLGPFGQWFNRNETWAELAYAWVDYLSRTSYLLQQGRFAADIVYFYGEDSNLTTIFADHAPPVPPGYGFDYLNEDGLIHELRVTHGRITTPSGMSYRVLMLDPNSRLMSLPVLKAIDRLVRAGAVVAGPKPRDDSSLADDATEFHKLSEELFGNGSGIHKIGQGTVYAGAEAGQVLKTLGIAPDFDYVQPPGGADLQCAHRVLGDGDIYFVDNRSARAVSVQAVFRVTGKAPQLWRAEDGTNKPASFNIAGGRTTVPLQLEPWGTVFVVFREPAREATRVVPEPDKTALATLERDWRIDFQPGRGAPASVAVRRLESWSESADPGVKYFSGIGTYHRTFEARLSWVRSGAPIWVDLGEVKNLAEVILNGQSLGVVWHAPYRLEITSALKPGRNDLAIRVANAWVNRLVGDQQPGVTRPITFADIKPYRANSPLLPSGLLGPVTLERIGGPAVKPDEHRKK